MNSRLVRGLETPRSLGLTVPYAAPELFLRMRRIRDACTTADTALDVYAYGVSLYEMITRSPPWPNTASPEAICMQVTAGVRPPLSPRVTDQVSPRWLINELVPACWSHSPEERPTFADILKTFSSHAQ